MHCTTPWSQRAHNVDRTSITQLWDKVDSTLAVTLNLVEQTLSERCVPAGEYV